MTDIKPLDMSLHLATKVSGYLRKEGYLLGNIEEELADFDKKILVTPHEHSGDHMMEYQITITPIFPEKK